MNGYIQSIYIRVLKLFCENSFVNLPVYYLSYLAKYKCKCKCNSNSTLDTIVSDA